MTKEQFAAFGEELWKELTRRCGCGDWNENDDEIFEIAQKHGLVQRVKYNEALHGPLDGAGYINGDMIWWWGNTSHHATQQIVASD
jgi:hypothetical protein